MEESTMRGDITQRLYENEIMSTFQKLSVDIFVLMDTWYVNLVLNTTTRKIIFPFNILNA